MYYRLMVFIGIRIEKDVKYMDSRAKVSIVLPVYNVADYLKECIQSILNQTFKEYELILVDDGSTDGSEIMCDQYKKKDERIVVVHQKNGGLSAARNTGMNYAKAEYITFIDSDDFVGPQYIELLYESVIKNDADISICDYKEVSQNATIGSIDYCEKDNIKELSLDKEETIKQVYKTDYHGIEFVSWAKIYKLDLFKSNDIYFPEGRLHEDAFTTYKLFYISKKITYIDIPLYFYRIRSGSIMTSEFSEKRLDMICATREEYQFFKKNDNYELMRLAFFDHLHKVKLILKMIYNSSGNKRKISNKVCKDLNKDLEECKNYISIPFVKYVYYKGLVKFPQMFILLGELI